jgi:hypothetical protein
MQTREVGFQHLSMLASEGGMFILGGSTGDVVDNTFFFSLVFMVSIGGVVGRFVPVVMVERGDATGALGLFQILSVLQSILLCYILCQ